MEDLRIILAIIGGIVVAGIYFHYRQRGNEDDVDFDRKEADEIKELLEEPLSDDSASGETGEFGDLPKLSAVDEALEDDPEFGEADAGIDAGTERPAGGSRKEKIIAMMILPKEPGHRFWGPDLMDVFERAGLEYGEFDIFHRILPTDEGPRSVFSVASATEPGSFDISDMPEQHFKGLSMFMLLPGPQRGVDAFADMLATARRIAEQIGGEVMDRERSTMTKQTAKHVREDIIAFEHGLENDS